MKWLNGNRMKTVVIGVVAAFLLSGGNVKADFTFGEPVNLGPLINSPAWEYTHCVSADNLELYFGSYRDGGYGASDIYVSTRETTDEAWGPPENLGLPINTDDDDLGVCLSADGLELYFHSWRSTGLGGGDIWVTRRAAKGEPWGEPVNLGTPINSEIDEYNPCLSADGLELYFVFGQWEPEDGPIELTIGVSRRETKDASWGEPESLGPVVNSWSCQDTPWISSDGRVLVFTDVWVCEPRPGGYGATDIWLTRRANKDAEWSEPVNLGPPVNTEFEEDLSMISADGSMLYFDSDRPGGSGEGDLWQAPILPVVDFNSDGIVDSADLCVMVDHWGTDNSLCDIGPMPWGDGVVDVHDLIVLAEHLFEEIPPAGPSGNIIWVSDQSDKNEDGAPDDYEWVDILEAEGYTVDYTMGAAPGRGYWRTLDGNKIRALNAADLIIISTNAASSQHSNGLEPTHWNSVTTPIIITDASLAMVPEWQWLNVRFPYISGSLNSKLDILAPNHPIFADVISPVQITHGEGRTLFPIVTDCGVGNGTMLAKLVTPLARDYAAIVEWEPGVKFYDGAGQIAGGPRMLFCAGTDSSPRGLGVMNLTPDGLKIFLNAVKMYTGR
jgi:hypothetical protein